MGDQPFAGSTQEPQEPPERLQRAEGPVPTLVIACGALAHEIVALRRLNGWQHMDVQCLPADLHNRPERIPDALRAKIRQFRPRYATIFVAYADCGTGGLLDVVCREEGVERIPGAHCYEFYAGSADFEALAEEEVGTFYLTDFLLKHFERLIIRGLGLDKHPELMPLYFGNYRRLVYLAQREAPGQREAGQAAADRLGLTYAYRVTGYGELEHSLRRSLPHEGVITWQN